jgi:uncharacterized protein YbcI
MLQCTRENQSGITLMRKKTRGESEAEFTQAIIKLEKEYLGRGPSDARTFLVSDMVLVRLRGILTPAELKLAETSDGKTLVKESRRQLFETIRPQIEDIATEVFECNVISLHTDVSTKSGERVIVLTVDVDFTESFD